MFQVGKWYTITIVEGGDEGYCDYKVLEFNSPLLRLQGAAGEFILNTSSPMFVRASLSRFQSDEERQPIRLDLS